MSADDAFVGIGATMYFKIESSAGSIPNGEFESEEALAILEGIAASSGDEGLRKLASLSKSTRVVRTRAHVADDGAGALVFECPADAELDLCGILLVIALHRYTQRIDEQVSERLTQQASFLAAPPNFVPEMRYPMPVPPYSQQLDESGVDWTPQQLRLIDFVVHAFDTGALTRLADAGLSVVLRTSFASSLPLLSCVRLVVAGLPGVWTDVEALLMAVSCVPGEQPVDGIVVICHTLVAEHVRSLCATLCAARVYGHGEAEDRSQTTANICVVLDSPCGAVHETFTRFAARNRVRHQITLVKAHKAPSLSRLAEIVSSDSKSGSDRLLQAMRYSTYHCATITRLFALVYELGQSEIEPIDVNVTLDEREAADLRRLAHDCALPALEAALPIATRAVESGANEACHQMHRFLSGGCAMLMENTAAGDSARAEECSVCMGPVVWPLRLGCSHTFCAGCILQWAKDHPSCPHCRTEIESVKIGSQRGPEETEELPDSACAELPDLPDFACAELPNLPDEACAELPGAHSKVRCIAERVGAGPTVVIAPTGCVYLLAAEIQNYVDVNVSALDQTDTYMSWNRAGAHTSEVLVTDAATAGLGLPMRPTRVVLLTRNRDEQALASNLLSGVAAGDDAVLRVTVAGTVDDLVDDRLDQKLAVLA